MHTRPTKQIQTALPGGSDSPRERGSRIAFFILFVGITLAISSIRTFDPELNDTDFSGKENDSSGVEDAASHIRSPSRGGVQKFKADSVRVAPIESVELWQIFPTAPTTPTPIGVDGPEREAVPEPSRSPLEIADPLDVLVLVMTFPISIEATPDPPAGFERGVLETRAPEKAAIKMRMAARAGGSA